MFRLSPSPLDSAAYRDELRDPGAGAYVAFEGWVRDHNEGKRVLRLDYEAYEAMAVKEGQRIVERAVARFGLIAAHCVHRTGALSIGDMAVWVGASSSHRGEAFKACRYIIDEVKHRVPIWKKEHYADGDTGWVNCETCGHGHIAFTEDAYYDRQIRIPQFGRGGQEKLRRARVLVVGAGGLGVPVLQYLAAAGVGNIGICDGDDLDASNLHRQPLFNFEDIGGNKAELAGQRLRTLNPFVGVAVYPERIDVGSAGEMVEGYDLVLDCTDNFETKFLLNDTAVLTKTALISASVYQFEGQLSRYVPGGQTPCLRCLWPEMPEPGCIGSCADVGVLGVVPGILGVLQATEAIKHIVGLPSVLKDELLIVDCLSYRVNRVRSRRSANCPVCSGSPTITSIGHDGVTAGAPRGEHAVSDDIEISPARLREERDAYTVIDMREEHEIAARPIEGYRSEPISAEELFRHPGDRLDDRSYVLCCSYGHRSRSLALHLRRQGYARVYSLQGGAEGLNH